uniref:Fatty-acid and retinol-binding protein 1 n=1 Tax=Rhabditophanes sp. KR3021 TaxID=114890 RepID=A0AC35TIF5_9BILA
MVSASIIILAVVAVTCAYANSVPSLHYDQIPDALKEFVPEEVKDFYKGLTADDRAVLVSLAKDHGKYSETTHRNTMVSASIIILAVVAVTCAYANSVPSLHYDQIPDALKEFVPEEVKDFYKGLTADDRAVLVSLAKDHGKYVNEDDALNALKEKSEPLYNRAMVLHNLVKDKVNSLSEEPKTYVTALIAQLRSLRPAAGEKPDLTKVKEIASEYIAKYKALSEASKDELKTTFPKITAVIQNEKFQALAKGFLQTAN